MERTRRVKDVAQPAMEANPDWQNRASVRVSPSPAMKTKIFPGVFLAAPLLAASVWAAEAPPVILLWPGDAPGSEGKTAEEKVRLSPEGEHILSGIHRPSLTVFLPAKDKATGVAVVICPGGGHRELWMDHEGYNVARWLAAHGIAGFILKYRLAHEEGSTYQVGIHSLANAQRAVRLVRSRAAEWNVDPARVGVMGFSAGGELAALAGMHFARGADGAVDPVDRQGSKPAFQALLYPGNPESIVPVRDSPPAFLACGYDDQADISEGLARVYLRFKQTGVPAELHIYTGAGHGFGLRESNHFPAGAWPERFREWLADRGFLGGSR
jgi:acetyl esterase/lipase